MDVLTTEFELQQAKQIFDLRRIIAQQMIHIANLELQLIGLESKTLSSTMKNVE